MGEGENPVLLLPINQVNNFYDLDDGLLCNLMKWMLLSESLLANFLQ
jgi:hypothetical protein